MTIVRNRIAAHAALAEMVAREVGVWPHQMYAHKALTELGLQPVQIEALQRTAWLRFGGGEPTVWETVGDAIRDLTQRMPNAPACTGEPIASDMIQSVAGFFAKYRETGAQMRPEDVQVMATNLELIAELTRSLEGTRTWFLDECRHAQAQLVRVTTPRVVGASAEAPNAVTERAQIRVRYEAAAGVVNFFNHDLTTPHWLMAVALKDVADWVWTFGKTPGDQTLLRYRIPLDTGGGWLFIHERTICVTRGGTSVEAPITDIYDGLSATIPA